MIYWSCSRALARVDWNQKSIALLSTLDRWTVANRDRSRGSIESNNVGISDKDQAWVKVQKKKKKKEKAICHNTGWG